MRIEVYSDTGDSGIETLRRIGLTARVVEIVESLFFFQAEDDIRDIGVTGVQTCALPIWMTSRSPDLSGDLLVIPANRISDGSEYGPPGYEGEEPLSVLPHRAPPEAPIGEPTCDEKDGNWACTASPLHAGDHASHGAGNVMHQWQRAPASEDATT